MALSQVNIFSAETVHNLENNRECSLNWNQFDSSPPTELQGEAKNNCRGTFFEKFLMS